MPRTLDAHGSLAHWVEQADTHGNVGAVVVASPHLPDEIVLLALPERPSDLVAGYDGVLYLALGDRVLMHDLRGRWPDEAVRLAGFAPWRMAADAAGGAWIIERASGRLARLEGLPLPLRPHADYAATTFRPSPENPRPPALRVLDGVLWPSGERPVALAAHPQQGLALLSWMDAGQARLRRLDADTETLGAPISLPDARYAYALAWLDDERFALRLPGRHDAPAFALDDGEADDARAPLGEIYPLADDAVEAPFVHQPRWSAALSDRHRLRAAARALDCQSRAPRRSAELRRRADAPARQRQPGDRVASPLCRGVDSARRGFHRVARRDRRARSADR